MRRRSFSETWSPQEVVSGDEGGLAEYAGEIVTLKYVF